jgi:RNA polymerase sigma-70 factor (ECF subfamily)
MSSPPKADREPRFRALYERNYTDVLRFARRRGEPEHAEDVAHETFLVAWRRLNDVPARPGDARAWLFGVARGCLLNAQRSHARRGSLSVRIASESPTSVAGHDDAAVLRADLAAAWRRLSPAEQEALSLAVWEDLPSPQAGRVLGISAAAYRLRLHRARAALRRELADTSALSPTLDYPAMESAR